MPWTAHEAICVCLSDVHRFGELLAESAKRMLGVDQPSIGERSALPAVLGVGLASTTCSLWYCATAWPGVLGILFPSSSWQISAVMGSLACVSTVCLLHCQATIIGCRGDLSLSNQQRLLAAGAILYANLSVMPILAHFSALHPKVKFLLLANKLGFAFGAIQFRESVRRASGDLIKARATCDRPRRQTLSLFLWQEFELGVEFACAALLIDAPTSAGRAVLANACSRLTATFGVAWLFWWPRDFFQTAWLGFVELL